MTKDAFIFQNLPELKAQSVAAIRQHVSEDFVPEVAIVLGSGLGALADEIENPTIVSYDQIPSFPQSTAPGHQGRLILGNLAGRPVVAMQGRTHLYEGVSAAQVAFPVRVMHGLGAKSLLVSNACGGINTALSAGDLMLQEDFINFTNDNALIGPHHEEFGERFPVMFDCYDKEYLELAQATAKQEGIALQKGIYLAISGPAYSTRAELVLYNKIADAIGMSTVHEVAVARQEGMRVLGISSVTDVVYGSKHAKGDDVVSMAEQIGPKFCQLVKAILPQL